MRPGRVGAVRCGSVLLAVALGHATPAKSESLRDGALELEWEAPPSCPAGAAVLARVRELLARSEPVHEPIRARAVVNEAGDDGQWELVLETVQGERRWRRSVRGVSCDELVEAGALIVALAVHPELAVDAPRSEPTETPPVASEREGEEPDRPRAPPPSAKPSTSPPPPAATAASPSSPPHGRPLHGGVAAAGVLDVGSLPRAAAGAELSLFIALEPVRVELVALGLPRVREVIAEDPERGGEIELWGGGLRACVSVPLARAALGPCAGFEGGVSRGSGFGTPDDSDESSRWIAVRGGGLATLRLMGPVALRASAEAVVPAVRPEFEIERVGPVHRASPVIARAALGLELRLR